MVITDGNITNAILTAINGAWHEVNKKSTYMFGVKNGDPGQPLVSIDSARPVDYKIFCNDGTCYVEIKNVKYKLWYRENDKDERLELHSTKAKLKLERI